MAEEGGIAELVEYAQSYSSPAIAIKQALVSLDENQEGDPVVGTGLRRMEWTAASRNEPGETPDRPRGREQ